MNINLKGKSVIITASSKGLGKATAKKFAEEGANVVISSRNKKELESTKKEIQSETGNNKIESFVCDMTNLQDIQNLVQRTYDKNGAIDVLINNTGGPPAGAFNQVKDSDWQYAFELNLLSFIRTIREVLPHMHEKKGGRIINFVSSSIKQPIDNLILSNTFRTGIVGLSKSLSQELAYDNILINTVGPGRIATERVSHLDNLKAEQLGATYEDVKKMSESSIPMNRYGSPEEFANLIVFLSSEANTYITGQSILVDGGKTKAL